MSDDFNWNTDPEVVVSPQRAVAVYLNFRKDIIIRQEQGPCDCEDVVVAVSPVHALAVAYGILDLIDRDYMIAARNDRGDWSAVDRPQRPPRLESDEPDDEPEPSSWSPPTVPAENANGGQPEAGPMEVARQLLEADPERSNRSIARSAGVSEKSVRRLRAACTATSAASADVAAPAAAEEPNRLNGSTPRHLDAAE